MKILIAPDSMKGCLPALNVAQHIAEGIKSISPLAETYCLPVADGGEGTLESVITATGGQMLCARVHNPLMNNTEACWGLSADGKTAVIEMATASGIELLKEEELNPLLTSTYGTGELIRHALNKNVEKIIIGLGGSATNDGGVGMLQALGALFLDKNNQSIPFGGGGLDKLHNIDLTDIDERLSSCRLLVACDVKNPLVGPQGATYVYSKQKGATPEIMDKLESNLQHYADLVEEQLGVSIAKTAGAGAAGGLGAGLMLLGAQLKPGFDIVSQEVGLEEQVEMADLVITGEGKIDQQTQFGKTPFGVAEVAKRYNKPVVAFAGTLGNGTDSLYEQGFDVIIPIVNRPMPLQDAINKAPDLLTEAAARMMRLLRLGSLLPYADL